MNALANDPGSRCTRAKLASALAPLQAEGAGSARSAGEHNASPVAHRPSPIAHRASHITHARQRGVAAVLAMMFLVIFGSLAAAMAIVAQGNLASADSQLKVNRALASAETGMRLVRTRLAQVATTVKTDEGEISQALASQLWNEDVLPALEDAFDFPFAPAPQRDGDQLVIGPIEISPDGSAPAFSATFIPHPLPGEDYDGPLYQRPPYSDMTPPVSNNDPLDARWFRVRVTASDGPAGHTVTRSVSMDFRITKRIPYAILSKNQVMIGRNVMIEGPVGSSFTDTHLEHGHPIQMLSDFRGLSDDLDEDLEALLGTLIANDADGDNRINLADPAEYDGQGNLDQYDMTGDGYVDEFDLFLYHFADPNTGQVTLDSFKSQVSDPARAEELFYLIDRAGYGPGDPPPEWTGDPDDFPGRVGWGDGYIDHRDRYAKVRGSIYITAHADDWNDGAAGGAYQDHFKGPIRPDRGEPATDFASTHNDQYEFGPEDFNVGHFRDMATGDFWAQVNAQKGADPLPEVREEVPYGSPHPYEWYDRPVIEGMTFTNVLIPKGTNALFRNCTFIGVTFIETETANTDPHFNFAGMQEADGTPRFPDRTAFIPGHGEVNDTRPYSNNIRFENCTFHGSVVTDAPQDYTHVRNKLEFNGPTSFEIDDSDQLTETERELFRRSTLMAPHYSVELGSFTVPDDPDDRVELSGTIVAGIFDMRGNIRIDGTLLTTFHPVPGEGPVLGDTSPLFNTTLGYFGPDHGDFESEIPTTGGLGLIHLRYNPTLPLPDGITGPVQFEPLHQTYTEGGQ